MNKHLHRIVFNAARGTRMVVQETARSAGKAASGATLAASALLLATPSLAQIAADPNAPGHQRPTVMTAPNGVPLVNIQTPSAAGVSRNTYRQFDVNGNGAILNNSRTQVQTQLGGFVAGNPWLAKGPARIILNEVNSANPSQLRGFVEVAGQRAEVVIANPAGIQVDGAGFINASRVTLTTGTAQFAADGGLQGFLVRGGTISIEGAGLDASKTDYTAILSRALQVNAGIWANELKVVAGTGEVSADAGQVTPGAGNGPAPVFALDVAALGGMYAGKITLIGTEAGLGVRNAGTIGAGAGGLVVTAAGRLENTGTLQAAKVELASAGDIDNRGGVIRQAGTRDLAITASVLRNTNGGVIGAEAVPEAGAATPPAAGTTVPGTGGKSAVPPAAGTDTSPAEAAPLQPPAATGPGAITAAGTLHNDGGRIYAGGEIALQAAQLDNRSGGVLNLGALAFTGERFSNAGGTLNVANTLSATVGSLDNTGGKLQAGHISITTTGDLDNRGGTLSSNGHADLAVGGAALNTQGTVSAVGALNATVAGTLDNSAGKLLGNEALTISAGALNNTNGAVQAAHGATRLAIAQHLANDKGSVGAGSDLSVQAGSLANTGTLRAENDSTIAVAGVLANEGAVTAGRQTTITAATLSNNASGVLGAGVQATGNLGAAGDLRVTTTGALTASGTTLAAGGVTLQGASADLSGNQISGANITLTATAGDVTTRHATVTTPGTLKVVAKASASQSLNNEAGSLSAGQLDLQAANLRNTHTGQIVQTGNGATTIAVAGTLDNTSGRLASNGQDLRLGAATLVNANGQLQHAGNGTLELEAGSYHGKQGEIITNGAFVADVAGGFEQDGGTLTAKRLTVDVGLLSNVGGSITQTGTAFTHIAAAGALDNSAGGQIASNGDLTIASASLRNQGGSVRSAGAASLAITTTGLLDNGTAGVISSAGNIDLRAANLSNAAGSVTAVGQLDATVSGAISNADGTLAANGNTALAAASLDNSRGSIASAKGDLAITSTGATVNTAGALQAAGHATLVNAGLTNTQGKVTGNALSVNTHGATLTNTLGTLAANTTVDLQSGALNNDKGLVQSGGAMAIDTHGQALANTNAAGHAFGQGGIASGGALDLAAGATDNTTGFIGANGSLTAHTGAWTNAVGGVVLGQADVAISTHGASYDNRGGKTLALGHLSIDAGSGTVHNSGALLRSAGTTTVSGSAVNNQSTLGTDQGIEGGNVVIAAANANNSAGAVRADANVTIHGSGTVDNTNGLISAGDALAIRDANPGARALSLANTGGTLTANNSLYLDAANFSGDGTLTSGRDLSLSFAQDLVNHATVSANGNLSYATTGTLTNHGKLLAGQTLTVSGRDVENTATGEMRGHTTVVQASGTLTNRGLIDGHDTRIDAGILVNAPTGRVYGDDISIAAGSLLNAADGTSAGSIAARNSLHIGAGSVTNEQNALIFSAGDLHIGGALDANRRATGTTALVENKAATIEALGNVSIQASTLRNLNGGVTAMAASTHSQHVVEFGLEGSPERWKADEVLLAVRSRVNSNVINGWSAVAGHAPDTNDDDPGPRLLLPSPDYPLAKFAAYYAVSPLRSIASSYQECPGGDGDCITKTAPGAWYRGSDPIWSTFGVTPPARDLSIGHPLRLDPNAGLGQPGVYGQDDEGNRVVAQYFEHPVTQAEIDEGHAYHAAHGQLDAATTRFIQTILGGDVAGLGSLPGRLHKAYNVWEYTVTQSNPALETSAPAKILAGGNMTLTVGAGINEASQIMAGGALSVQGGSIENRAAEAQATTVIDGKAMNAYLHEGWESARRYRITAYNPVIPPTTVTLAAARMEGGASLSGATSGQTPAREQSVRITADTQAAGSVQASQRVNPIVEVPSAMGGTPGLTRASAHAGGPTASNNRTSATAPQSLVVRTSTPNTTVPQASLFKTSTDAASRYLVETDPAFANYRNWLSSDYLLGALGHDPAAVTKRLGDGFYEQRLIREQVAQLTGYRYPGGADDDQSQYAALMDAGVTFAKAYQLRPGIALSAAQMAQLTSDIVWLVEQTVTLADGSTQRVLVPQVYVRIKPGDIDGSGTLLSADTLRIHNEAGQGDVLNSGTLAGRSLVALTADNVHNLGGRITGASVGVNARTDLANIGGTIEAQNAAVLTAGRDIRIASTAQTAVGPQGSATALDRLAAVYVSHPGGTLVARAGQDVQLVGAVLSNTGEGGLTSVQAGRDIQLDTLKTRSSQDTTWNARNYQRTSESAEVSSTITANGTTVLNAGRDIAIRQGTVDAGTGLLSMQAGNDITIAAGQSTQTYEEARHRKTSGFMSSTTRTAHYQQDETLSQGSSLSGQLVSITANHNIGIQGSAIRGTDGVLVRARNVLAVAEGRDSHSESSSVSIKKSGFAGSFGGIPVPIGAASRDALTADSKTAVASTITSAHGGVLLQGDGALILQGVKIDAAKDITLQGGIVAIAAATNSTASTSEHYKRGTHIGLTLVHGLGKGIDAKNTDTVGQQESTLERTTLKGQNVSITATGADGQGGELSISGTTVETPGALTLNADKLALGTQTTQVNLSHTSQGGDVAWQKAEGQGRSDQTTQYNQFHAGSVALNANTMQVGLGARDSVEALGQQPGMGWVQQIARDPQLAGKVDWAKVEEAHEHWNYSQHGLTPAAAAVITVVVAYFTAGTASTWGASVGNTVAAGTGMGATGAAVVGGAVTAGVSALASQAAVALINNQGNLGKTLDDLGSSASVKGLLTAVVTGGVLSGLNLTGTPTATGGVDRFMEQLGQNLQAGAARAVIDTAINGGSLEDNLKNSLKTALLDTLAAETANAIGDISGENGSLNAFTNKVAHAMAGCVVGAARTDTSGGCSAGAIGAAIGEMAAEAYGRRADTTQFASMMSGIAAALTGASAAEINLASQAGANAAANNYLNHDQAARSKALTEKCAAKQCTPSEVDELKSLRALDAWLDKQLEVNCQNLSSSECQSSYADLRAAQQSYAGKNPLLLSASERQELDYINANLEIYSYRMANPTSFGVATGLVKIGVGAVAAPFYIAYLAGTAVIGDAASQAALKDLVVNAAVTVTDLPAAAQRMMAQADAAEAAGNPSLAAQIRTELVLNTALLGYSATQLVRSAGTASIGANGGVNPALLNELTANGVKFTPENVIATARSPSGQVVFLETGDSYSGLTHIVQRHATDFANIGISEVQIPSVVTRAVSEGNIVGYQGRGTGRPIYEVTVNGQPRRISITTGNNGYIVGANPAGSAP